MNEDYFEACHFSSGQSSHTGYTVTLWLPPFKNKQFSDGRFYMYEIDFEIDSCLIIICMNYTIIFLEDYLPFRKQFSDGGFYVYEVDYYL